ncbi:MULTISPECIES: hypothetical protein [unclassified Pseudomonas]|uniref:hypothetical protein n=1 Tax=unclassified Pseudomonas TaxID=196821 RepID=UPI0008B84A75|nr:MULTISPECIES: hypothetical protein [unclassified Pseudomonas]SEP03377.1 hypothetical protein SAMN03159293_04829 [Pseudomonas sp. NFACC39-1]SFG76651.1 hypothetical protein SAMN03159297_01204 [Pseudomonas sp. NFACC45]
MNTKYSRTQPTLLTLSLLLSGMTFQAFAAQGEPCNADKVAQAKELKPGGMSETALSEEDYVKQLNLEAVRVTGVAMSKDTKDFRLTVVTDANKKVINMFCD